MNIDIKQAISQSAEDLIDLGIVEDYCHVNLLENAITKWLEKLIDELPDNIEWFYQNYSDLQRFIEGAEGESAKLDLDQEYPNGINLEDFLSDVDDVVVNDEQQEEVIDLAELLAS